MCFDEDASDESGQQKRVGQKAEELESEKEEEGNFFEKIDKGKRGSSSSDTTTSTITSMESTSQNAANSIKRKRKM